MTEDEIEEVNEQIAEAGGTKYVNGFTVIGDPYDMSILFMTDQVPTSSVTISYKACLALIEMMQETLDSAKTKEIKPNGGTVLEEALLKGVSMANAQLEKQRYDNLTGFEG